MIYIDSTSDIVYFPRTKDIATKLICINQISKTEIEIPVLETTSKYYVINFVGQLRAFENGQYDYMFRNYEGDEIISGILQFGDYNSDSDANYEVGIEFIQYTPDSI